jgi:hypothetical protein
MSYEEDDPGETLDKDTASFFRAIGFVLLCASGGGLMLWLCAWSARMLWLKFQAL